MIIAIVPAAGQSRRMSAHKQLLPFAGKTVIAHLVDELCRSRVDEVCVVAGHQADLLRQALEGRRANIVVNADYERTDMLASVRCGLTAMPAACRAVLVALGDQPGVTAELVNAMIEGLASGGRRIVVPLYQGRRGHPLLFDARYCEEVLNGFDDVGLRGLLVAHADDVLGLPVSDAAVLTDVDYPEDYQRELARLSVFPSEKG